MQIKSIIIDDESLAQLELKELLKKHSNVRVLACAANADVAIELIREHRPDLIFLDINMPGKSGFALLEELDDVPWVIFITAHDQFALQAFEANALDYLLKPLNPDRLREALDKVSRLVDHGRNEQQMPIDRKIFIKDGERCYFVPLSEVFLIESVGNYARFFFQQQRPLLHRTLSYLEQRLPASHFFRISRQYIVNTQYIRNITPVHNHMLLLELHSGQRVEVSQRQSALFRELMGI